MCHSWWFQCGSNLIFSHIWIRSNSDCICQCEIGFFLLIRGRLLSSGGGLLILDCLSSRCHWYLVLARWSSHLRTAPVPAAGWLCVVWPSRSGLCFSCCAHQRNSFFLGYRQLHFWRRWWVLDQTSMRASGRCLAPSCHVRALGYLPLCSSSGRWQHWLQTSMIIYLLSWSASPARTWSNSKMDWFPLIFWQGRHSPVWSYQPYCSSRNDVDPMCEIQLRNFDARHHHPAMAWFLHVYSSYPGTDSSSSTDHLDWTCMWASSFTFFYCFLVSQLQVIQMMASTKLSCSFMMISLLLFPQIYHWAALGSIDLCAFSFSTGITSILLLWFYN